MSEQSGFYSFREQGQTLFQSFALELVPGKRCQLDCASCFKRSSKTASGDMPVAFVESALGQAKACGFAEAVFIGGEPTLHPDLPEFVSLALSLGLSPIICTNGIKLAEASYALEIAKPGVTLVMHAPLPDGVQDAFVGAPGYSRKLSAAYANVLGRQGVRIIGEMVLVEEFLPHITLAYRWCAENGVIPFIEINRRADSGTAYRGTATPQSVQKMFAELASIDPKAPGLFVPPAYGQPCTMSITGLHIKNLGGGDCGGVYSCCAQGVCHGDLRNVPLANILASPTLAVFQDQDRWIYGPCRRYAHYQTCRGEAYLTFGCPRASSPSCWHLSPLVRASAAIMAPRTCAGCPLEGNPACHPSRPGRDYP